MIHSCSTRFCLSFALIFSFANNAQCGSGETVYKDGQTNIKHSSITQACEYFKQMFIDGMRPSQELCNVGAHSCPSDNELYAARIGFEENPNSFPGVPRRFYFSFWNEENKKLGNCYPLQEVATNFYVECKEAKEHILSPGVCAPYLINIEGQSSTEALPAVVGPVEQRVAIKHGSRPLKGFYASITIYDASTASTVMHAGHTDGAGNYNFLYVPPYFRSTEVKISASCAQCANIATKTISILNMESEESQMCRR